MQGRREGEGTRYGIPQHVTPNAQSGFVGYELVIRYSMVNGSAI